ncbi:MAG: ATP-binding protein [Kiritimatiellae bacterium]|nr:ATP-binding protein [Kiritimatiellia bacterium]
MNNSNNLFSPAPVTSDAFAELLQTSDRMLRSTPRGFHRYLYPQIDWTDRLVCIKGARGTGKTTLMLQYLRETFGVGSSAALYASLDDLWFATRRLKDLAVYLDTHGFTALFLDEVHRLPDWSVQIKNLHDQFLSLRIVYSGSSLLDIERAEADLSRRQATYTLDGLSFREFLVLEGVDAGAPVPLETLLADHRPIAAALAAKTKILPLFERYLRSGFYPFHKEARSRFRERLRATVNQVLDVDWPKAEPVSAATIHRAKRMLLVLASSVPQQPNMAALWRELGTERNQGMKMLRALDRARLLCLLAPHPPKLKNLSAPEKIYCGDPNLAHALAPRTDIGTLRETFFASQLRQGHTLHVPAAGDFLVDSRYLVEVGGPTKTFKQIADAPDSCIAVDGIESGWGNRIPLWLFGFLY